MRSCLLILSLVLLSPGLLFGVEKAGERGPLSVRITGGERADRVLYTYPRMSVKPNAVYFSYLKFRDHINSGSGLFIKPTFFDKGGGALPIKDQDWRIILREGNTNEWNEVSSYWIAPEGSSALTLSVVVPAGYRAFADLDAMNAGEATGKWGERNRARILRRRHIPLPSPARIREIAGYLSSQPSIPGGRASDRAYWDKLAKSPDGLRRIQRANEVLALPIPMPSEQDYLAFWKGDGDRSRYEKGYYGRIGNLQSLTIGECLENKGRFMAKINAYIETICQERTWLLSAHDHGLRNYYGKEIKIELGSSQRGCFLSYVLSMLGDRVPKALRIRAEKEIFRRIIMPYRRGVYQDHWPKHWWATSDTNWNAVCNGFCVKSALAMIEDPMIRAEFIACAEIYKEFYLRGFLQDGYCSEGIVYWNYGFGNMLNMALAVRTATQGKVNFLDGKKWRLVGAYPRDFEIDRNVSPFFADGSGRTGPIQWALMRQIWPERVPSYVERAPLLEGEITHISLRAFGQEEAAMSKHTASASLPIRSWFPYAQVLVCRPSPDHRRPSLGIGLKGGRNNDSHNHNDIGSYAVALDETYMTGDPGAVVYDRWTFSPRRYQNKMMNSYGHPVPVVNGVLQPAGNFRAKLVETRFTENEDQIVFDLTSVYPVKTLKKLLRTFTYDRKRQTVTITDKVSFSEPGTISVPFITYSKIEPGSSKGSFNLVRNGRILGAEFEVNGGKWKIERDTIPNPKKQMPERVAATLEESVLEASVSLRFSIVKGGQ